MRKKYQKRQFAIVAAAAVAAIQSSQSLAQTTLQPEFTISSGTLRNNFTGIIGNVIQVQHDTVIDQVGFIDLANPGGSVGDGLETSHDVGIWHSGWNFQGSATVPSGTAGTLVNNFRYVTLSEPIILAAGSFYTIGGTVTATSKGTDPASDVDTFWDVETVNYNTFFTGTLGAGTRAARYGSATTVGPGNEPTNQNTNNGAYVTANMISNYAPSTFTGASSGTLSDNGNYAGANVPNFTSAANSIIFGPSTNTTVNIDQSNVSLRGISIAAGAPSYNITGNGFRLIGGIENDSSNAVTFNNTSAITMYRDQTFNAFNGDIVMNGPVTLLDDTSGNAILATYGSHNVTLNGQVSGNAQFWANPTADASILTLSNNSNNFTGALQVMAGIVQVQASNALGDPGSASTPATGGTTITGNTGQLQIVGNGLSIPENIAISQRTNAIITNNTFTRSDIYNAGGSNTLAGTIVLTGSGNGNQQVIESAAGTLTLAGPVNTNYNSDQHTLVFTGAGNGVISGTIAEGSAPLRVVKTGSGSWTINHSDSFFTGGVAVNEGTFALDYTNDGGQSGDMINGDFGGNPVALGGGTLHIIGSSNGTSQSTGYTIVGAFPAQIIRTTGTTSTALTIQRSFTPGLPGSVVQIDPASGSSATLNLAAITRNQFGTVDFRGSGVAQTTTGNTNGIIGGWATINSTDWAANDGNNNIVATTAYSADTLGTGVNTDVTTDSTQTAAATNSIRFNVGGHILTLGGSTNLQSGGILVTPNVGAAGATLAGGTITLNNSSTAPDLIVNQLNTTAPFTISSVIANAASAPTSRTGTDLTITQTASTKTVSYPNTTEIQVPSTADLYVGLGVTGTGIPAGTLITGILDNQTILINNTPTLATTAANPTTTLSFTSNNQISKAGLGTLVLAANNTLTGPTVVGQGTLAVSSPNALSTSEVYLGDFATLTALTSSKVGGVTGTGTVIASPTAMLTVGGSIGDQFYGNVIQSGSGGNLTVNKSGSNSWTVSGNNAMTGTLTITNASRLNVRNQSWVTNPSNIVINSASEIYFLINMTSTTPISVGGYGFGGHSGAIHVGGNATVLSNSPISLTANSNVNLDSALSWIQNGNVNTNGYNWVLQSDTGTTATINGIISGTNGSLSISSGAWTLTAPNTYTGTTSIIGGVNSENATLTASTLGYVGGPASNLGQATDPALSGIILGGAKTGTLNYIGTGEMTDRNVTLGNAGAINNAGTGPLTFAGAFNLGTSTLTLSGNPNGSITGPITSTTVSGTSAAITMAGAGTWTVGNSATFGALTISSGTVAFNSSASSSIGAVSGAGSLVKSGSGLVSVSRLTPTNLSVTAGTLQVRQNGANTNVSIVSSLSVTGGQLDLYDNDMIVKYTAGNDPVATIRGLLAGGFNSGAWNGPGIDSTAAATNPTSLTALGYADGLISFDGQSFTNGVVIKYTYYGDSNLDGKVDVNDFALFLAGLTGNGSTWAQGDYTYDGHVDLGNDFNLFLVAYLQQGGSLGDLAPLIEGDSQLTTAQRAAMLAVVPEPSSVTVIGLAAAGLIGRRKRKSAVCHREK